MYLSLFSQLFEHEQGLLSSHFGPGWPHILHALDASDAVMRNFTAGASDVIPETPRTLIAEPTGLTYNKKPTKQSREFSAILILILSSSYHDTQYLPYFYHSISPQKLFMNARTETENRKPQKFFIVNCDTDPNITLLHTHLKLSPLSLWMRMCSRMDAKLTNSGEESSTVSVQERSSRVFTEYLRREDDRVSNAPLPVWFLNEWRPCWNHCCYQSNPLKQLSLPLI